MTQSNQDPLHQVYDGNEGFVNEARLSQRIDDKIRRYNSLWKTHSAGLIASILAAFITGYGATNILTHNWHIAALPLLGCVVLFLGSSALEKFLNYFAGHRNLPREIFKDSCYLVRQRQKVHSQSDKLSLPATYRAATQFLYDHPSISQRLFREIEKRATCITQRYETRAQGQEVHGIAKRQRQVLHTTIKRHFRLHGTPQEIAIVSAKTDHRAMLIELARDHNGLSGVNLLRHVTGWNRVL